MKITVFTGNQPRHTALVNALADVADELCLVMESGTRFPGVRVGHYAISDIMEQYFTRVRRAESTIFGVPWLATNVSTFALGAGELNFVELDRLSPCLDADLFVVFGSSYIKGPLASFLVERRALNLHMGTSPFYRGTACNFWALYDGNPDLVGATIHFLSQGLDNGPIICHATPSIDTDDPFIFTMQAVEEGVRKVVGIATGALGLAAIDPIEIGEGIRYSRNAEFTDDIAHEFLSRVESGEFLKLSQTNFHGRLIL